MVKVSCIVLGVKMFAVVFILWPTNVHSNVPDSTDSPLILTTLLDEERVSEAQELSRIKPDILNSKCFSGYFTVNQECESNLFFWFCQAQTNWEQSPVLLWLQGGPGCSSLMGLFLEIGPYSFKNGIPTENEHSWNKFGNLLFIDQPVGTGYSFTNEDCYARNKTEIANDLYSAILQFYRLFPILKQNRFYIAGESYAGHYIPYIAHHLHKMNAVSEHPVVLSGIMIGNGWMDAYYQYDYGNVLHTLGLADKQQKEILHQLIPQLRSHLKNKNWANASAESDKIFNTYLSIVKGIDRGNFLKNEDAFLGCDSNIPDLPFSIHVGSNKLGIYSSIVYYNLVLDNVFDEIQSSKVEIEELLEHYPVVLYFGQLDTICSYPVALKFLQDLQWSGAVDYKNTARKRWCVNGQLAGYYRSAHNLHEVLVRNAGHSVAIDQPLWAYILADSVTSGSPSDPLYNLTVCEDS